MKRFVALRLAQFVPTLLGMTLLTFLVARWAPGDPLQLDPQAPLDDVTLQARRLSLGLSGSPLRDYLRWLLALGRGEFGHSLVDQRLIAQKLAEALPATLMVSGGGVGIGCLTSLALGVVLAFRKRAPFTRFVEGVAALVSTLPQYWLALGLMLGLATPLGLTLFPLQGWASWKHVVLPITTVAVPIVGWGARLVSAAVGSALDADFCLAARGRGVSEVAVLLRHALPAAWSPLLAALGLALPMMVGGSVTVERAFGVPGMGLLALDAVFQRDYPTVMATTVVAAVATLAATLLVDVVAVLIDPRVRQRPV
jgi:peptide/nickel transport system permease protein